MTGYTAVLAVTAVMIVRLGKVWEDARSILFLVPLLFLAMSVSLDEMGIRYTRQMAVPLVLTAFAAAVVILLVLTRNLGIRLRGYGVAFLAVLAVFFLYPLGVMLFQEYVAPSNVNRRALAVLGFPGVQAAAFLTLWPAIRRGGFSRPQVATYDTWLVECCTQTLRYRSGARRSEASRTFDRSQAARETVAVLR
jgi:predicted neutral ceramidase superfamily lipid hydrolase